MQHWLRALVVLATPISLWAMAVDAAMADQLWEGRGRIIRGAGKGASVPILRLETDDASVVFLTGPEAGERIELDEEDAAETNAGIWQFLRAEDTLEVNLYQTEPYRVIHYILNLSNASE